MEAVWLNIQKWFNTRLKSLKADVNLAVNQRIKIAVKGGFTTDVKRSISSGERSQQRENTRPSESGKAFLSSFFLSFFLSSSLSLPFGCRSRVTFHVTVTMYIHQLKTLFAGYNISCGTLLL